MIFSLCVTINKRLIANTTIDANKSRVEAKPSSGGTIGSEKVHYEFQWAF